VSKVWDRITVHTFTGKREPEELAGRRNPDFLNPNLFLSDVLEPYRRWFSEHTGPFVFEFQTIAGWGPRAPDEFAERLDAFFSLLPREPLYAVEVRNEEFLTPAYFAVLREHNVGHVFSSWTRMPPLGAQMDMEGSITANFIVARALLKPGRLYEDAVKLFKPYDRIRDPYPDLRRDLARLARTSGELRLPAWLIVNNRAEGSARYVGGRRDAGRRRRRTAKGGERRPVNHGVTRRPRPPLPFAVRLLPSASLVSPAKAASPGSAPRRVRPRRVRRSHPALQVGLFLPIESDLGPPIHLGGAERQKRSRHAMAHGIGERAGRQPHHQGRGRKEGKHGRADEVRLGAEHLAGDDAGQAQQSLSQGVLKVGHRGSHVGRIREERTVR
jgi:hypothetical protein